MVAIVSRSYTRVTSGVRGNKQAVSISGVPGTGLSKAYIYVDIGIKLALAADNSVWIAAENGDIIQDHMSNIGGDNPWDVFLLARSNPFNVTIPVGATSLWDYVRDFWDRKTWWNGAANTNFTGHAHWGVKKDLDNTDHAADYGYTKLSFNMANVTTKWDNDTKKTMAVVYFNFPVLYRSSNAITSPITLSSQAVSVDATELVSYYPWSVRKGSIWASCNRQGGSFKTMKSGQYTDAKNSPSESAKQNAWIHKGSTWSKLPKTGQN